MTRLSTSTLSQLPASTARPAYDRNQTVGVIHLGTGAFHRAHQATYFDALMAAGETGWMIEGSSLRSASVASQMNPQDGLYTMLVRDGDEERQQIVGSVKGVVVAPEAPAALVAALARKSVALVTLTVTEKGYCIDPATGTLRTGDPAIASDIANIDAPKTAPGFLVAGLKARRTAGLKPFTVLSCDNLPENGMRTRQAVLAMAREVDAGLADWIEAEGAFPSSMVDRIVPATTEEDIAALESITGFRDEAMVKTEPFTQWVVEDWFSDRRPALETVGVQMTNDVPAWEKAKLRMLNGAHSALAYLGGLAGHTFVHQAIAAPGFEILVNQLWDEAERTLDPIEGFNSTAYRDALLKRFRNPALEHKTAQIAIDGSQKIPPRLLSVVREHREAGLPSPAAATLAIAGWINWQLGQTDDGTEFHVDDPLAMSTTRAAERGVSDILALRSIFDPSFSTDLDFANKLEQSVKCLSSSGASKTIQKLAAI